MAQSDRPEELILVDDGSDDGTGAELLRLAKEAEAFFPVRVLLARRNHGPAWARNLGWNQARQPWVAFLDADDTWHPRKLELHYAWMATHPEVGISGHRVCRAGRQPRPAPDRAEGMESRKVRRATMLLHNPFTPSAVMLRQDIGLRFAEDKRRCEDYLLWSEIVLQGGTAMFLDADLARRHKPPFGAGGLSGDLAAMEKDELDVYLRLYRQGRIVLAGLLIAWCFSLLRYVRRLSCCALPAWTVDQRLAQVQHTPL
jgi:glycosyltransferase involved in cell wall biosynthesis